ncbi:MAG TPA: hypothetical protein VFD27_21920 [Chthoniobacteraceae bacterium]|nr:hypothetical protein [Chthoniobacteraceae bacterium]
MQREPMVGSLIYGDHKVPKKSRPWKERWKLPTAVGLAFIVGAVLFYEYCNYREEGAVKQFLQTVFSDHPDAAFSKWDLDDGGSYTKQDFLSDWGKDGYYTKGATSAKVVDSNSRGTSVVVYVDLPNLKFPLALRVNKESLKLSYSPTNKYRAQASRE